jgi:ABC-type polysaccharide/polyol phosphate export permease
MSVEIEHRATYPSAAADRRNGLRRRLDVLYALAVSDLRARYGRGRWQLLKWLLDPFALVGVYLVLLTVVFDRGGEAAGLSLACSVVPFQIVTLSFGAALGSVTKREPILLNMGFDRLLIPLGAVATETLAFGASLVLLALMMAVYGIAPTLAALSLPLAIAATLAIAVGLAYPAAIFGLWFPQLRHVAGQVVRTLYFLAPGLVPLSEISEGARDWLRINPMTGLFEAYRDALLYGQFPAAWKLLYPAAVGLLLLAVFVPLYRKEQDQFAKTVAEA